MTSPFFNMFCEIIPNTRSYNTLLKGIRLLQGLELKLSLFILDFMKNQSIKPDVITVNTVVDACTRGGDFDAAQKVRYNLVNLLGLFYFINIYFDFLSVDSR